MKAFYLILCICFAMFITMEAKDVLKKYTEKLSNAQANDDACSTANGITIEFMEKLNKTMEELEAPEMEETRTKLGCYVSCLMQEKEILNGKIIDIQKINNMIKKVADSSEGISQDHINAVVTVVQDCGKQVENMTDVCQIGWKFGKCIGPVL